MMEHPRRINPFSARLIQVIETRLTRRGSGKSEEDPVRLVTQYWSVDGELLAERDHGAPPGAAGEGEAPR